jgi:hypothetical protein
VYNLTYNAGRYDYTQDKCDFSRVEHNYKAMSDLVENLNSFAEPHTYGHQEEVSKYIAEYNQGRQTELSMYDARIPDSRPPEWSASISVQSELPAPSLKEKLVGKFESSTSRASGLLKKPWKPDGGGWQQL